MVGALSSSQTEESAADIKSAANWMLGPIKSWLNENNAGIDQFPLSQQKIVAVILMIKNGKLSFSTASTRLFNELIKKPDGEPDRLAEEKNLLQNSNTEAIENLIDQVLNKFPEKVKEYRKGKKGIMSLFVGEVMKLSKGKADPKITNDILSEKLKS